MDIYCTQKRKFSTLQDKFKTHLPKILFLLAKISDNVYLAGLEDLEGAVVVVGSGAGAAGGVHGEVVFREHTLQHQGIGYHADVCADSYEGDFKGVVTVSGL